MAVEVQFLGRFTAKRSRVPRARRTDRFHVGALSLKWPLSPKQGI